MTTDCYHNIVIYCSLHELFACYDLTYHSMQILTTCSGTDLTFSVNGVVTHAQQPVYSALVKIVTLNASAGQAQSVSTKSNAQGSYSFTSLLVW